MLAITPYAIFDNVFTDPVYMSNMARHQKFYHPAEKDNWVGLRTEEVVSKTIYSAINKAFIVAELPPYTFNYKIECMSHILLASYTPDESWWHRDSRYCIFAGVIYLNEIPEPESGTEIKLANGEKIVVENKFNRMVLYDSRLLHRPQKGFGNNISDGRLTITFFITSIDFNFLYKTKENNVS